MDDLADGEPEDAVAEETGGDADEKHRPRSELVARVSWEKTHVLSEITGHAEDRDLLLVKP